MDSPNVTRHFGEFEKLPIVSSQGTQSQLFLSYIQRMNSYFFFFFFFGRNFIVPLQVGWVMQGHYQIIKSCKVGVEFFSLFQFTSHHWDFH
jgi:hypothetical protein